VLAGKSVVVAQFVFEFCKMTVNEIGCVGDLQGRTAQKGEQPWAVVRNAQEGTAKARMGVAGALAARDAVTFVEDPFPFVFSRF
jgi:hypothetical protein